VGTSLVAVDEELIVLRVVDGGLVVVAGERLDRVERVPQRERDELDEPAVEVTVPRKIRAIIARPRS
jgi:hypothetical protein